MIIGHELIIENRVIGVLAIVLASAQEARERGRKTEREPRVKQQCNDRQSGQDYSRLGSRRTRAHPSLFRALVAEPKCRTHTDDPDGDARTPVHWKGDATAHGRTHDA